MSEPRFLLDTGPIAAYFDPRDQYHSWAAQTIPQIEAPMMTCESVLTEAFYMLSKTYNGIDLLAAFCASGSLQVDFRILGNIEPIRELIKKYENVPMDLADACLVLLAEEHPEATVITTDSDFRIYRTRARRHIRLLAPFST